MPYIKKLVMHGFKSFAVKTEIPFEDAMNVIVGPNGSGKSNVTDALCFVLGRMSIKSMRAAKAANLIFSGNKSHKPSNEAVVELVFDNSDRGFASDAPEISVKRIVRRNGLSVYKINNEVKTRQELLELLATAGIDPNGFNIVLQGEIDSLVRSHPEERRKIIEEVAGISIYESRKHKSLLELDKADEKLKEVSAVLKERNAYLRNLEKERQEALSFQKLEENIKRCKATILSRKIHDKDREQQIIFNSVEEQNKKIERVKQEIFKREQEINSLEEQVSKINRDLQSSTSTEQETLHREIADLKAKIAGLQVRKENFESRLDQAKEKIANYKTKIQGNEKEMEGIKTSSPEIKKQQEQVKRHQEVFDTLERKRRQFYQIRSELSTLENKKSEREKTIIELRKEQEFIERNINALFDEIKYAKSIDKGISLKEKIKKDIEDSEAKLASLENQDLEVIKDSAIIAQTLSREEKLKQDIVRLDVCPLCQSKMTQEHVTHVIDEANKKIENLLKRQKQDEEKKTENQIKSRDLKNYLSGIKTQLNEIDIDLIKLKNADEKKNQMKRIFDSQESTKSELHELTSRITELRKEFEKLKNVEQEYDEARLKIQELSYKDMDVDSELAMKQRDTSRLQMELKAALRDAEESSQELKVLIEQLAENEKVIEKKEKDEKELYEKFQKLFERRNSLQDGQKAIETSIIGMQHEIRNFEDKINMFKIQKAKIDAEKDSLKLEFRELEKFELISGSLEEVSERLQKSQIKIQEIGSVNLRSLEVYDTVLEQCRQIEEKMQTVEKEKENIMKIIEEIDKKKKRSFFQTLDAINALFTRNFSQLSKKGSVFLEIENKQEPFSGGLNIILKVAQGKYFDVTSLSGGEKTLVALSLIFAIQEYKPYCFYVFDEIDAALDKHNSERLAALVKQYMTSGQYIIVTHNDALISEASSLYGVSMQENISKVISLKI
jgi:chromosome segregation protein